MRLDRFDLNLLVALDVLLDERNVTRASQRLHIGQPATSGALARLREHFGDALLVPVGRRMELTPLARSLVRPVHDALRLTRSALAVKPGFDPRTASRRFTVCASDYVVTLLLAPAAACLATSAPNVGLDLRSPPADVLDAFERGGIDVLILPEPYLASLRSPTQPLFSDVQTCVVWQGNTQVADAIGMEEYLAARHVALRMGEQLSSAFEDWFLPRTGQRRQIDATVDHFSTLPLLLLNTQRVATLPRRLATYFSARDQVRLVQPPFDLAPSWETMAWPHHLDADPAHRWLRTMLLDMATEMS